MRTQFLGLAFCVAACAAPLSILKGSDPSKETGADLIVPWWLLNTYCPSLNTDYRNIEHNPDHDLDTRGLINLDGLLDIVSGLVGQLGNTVASVLKSTDPSLANDDRQLFKHLDAVLSQVTHSVEADSDAVPIKPLLDEVHSLVGQIEDILADVLAEASPSLGKDVRKLLKQLDKVVTNVLDAATKVTPRDVGSLLPYDFGDVLDVDDIRNSTKALHELFQKLEQTPLEGYKSAILAKAAGSMIDDVDQLAPKLNDFEEWEALGQATELLGATKAILELDRLKKLDAFLAKDIRNQLEKAEFVVTIFKLGRQAAYVLPSFPDIDDGASTAAQRLG